MSTPVHPHTAAQRGSVKPKQTTPSPSKTQHGQKTTVNVGLFRAGSILCTALIFASAGFLLANLFTKHHPNTAIWLFIVLGTLGASLCTYAEITYGVKHARIEEKALRARLLKRFFTSALNDSKAPPARHIALMTDSVERVTEYRQIYWGATIASLISPIIILLYITVLDWGSGLLILCIVPLAPCTIWFFFTYFRKVSGNSRAKREALSVSYLDAIRQLIPIRLFGAGQRIENALRARGEENRRAVMKLLAANQIVIIVMDAVFLLLLICWSVFVISWRAHSGALATGQALSATLVLPLLLEPLTQVAGFFYIGMGGRASQRVINRFLSGGGLSAGHPGSRPGGHPGSVHRADGQHRPVSYPKPQKQVFSQLTIDSAQAYQNLDLSQAISVRNLHHDFGRGPVFTNLSFDIPKGAKVALVGPSGVGKSTLLSLLGGTLKIQDGAIAVTGQKFADLSPADIPLTSASVAQSTWLFTGTIADNLRFARSDAGEEEMWDALTKAHLAQDIEAMPQGLKTEVGEAGSRLSGGQAQRLSLARAFLAGRKVILLDEPTSHIDAESEAEVLKALSEVDADTTLLMVTHRPSLLAIADTVMTCSEAGIEIQQGDRHAE